MMLSPVAIPLCDAKIYVHVYRSGIGASFVRISQTGSWNHKDSGIVGKVKKVSRDPDSEFRFWNNHSISVI